MSMTYRVLTVSGSDSGGGAGIQADLKTFQELNVYGMSAITVVTAQNTRGSQAVYPQSCECIAQQLHSVYADIGVDAVKTGMMYSADRIKQVADVLTQYKAKHLVIDPVMTATQDQTELLKSDAIYALQTYLFPMAEVITPNIPEACQLLNIPGIDSLEEMINAVIKLHKFGSKHVVLKGGHLTGPSCVDVWYDGQQTVLYDTPKILVNNSHGTGCTFASAIAAELAKGSTMKAAIEKAKAFVTAAIASAYNFGSGGGPINQSASRPIGFS
jgi:hydroxymethylpyrimidine/phosphomethylpyrimidine kinase